MSITDTALVVVDVQQAFEQWDAMGRRRNNAGAVNRIAELLEAFRSKGAPIIHVRHASLEPESLFGAELPGHRVIEAAAEADGEPVVVKHVNSSFIGTDLEERLRRQGIRSVVVVGATTNHCVETTTRMAGNLGFDAKLVRDATWTYDRVGVDGEAFPAEQVHAMTLANLAEEFAEIVTTEEVISRLT
ncbi:MAG: cysteine hydrolase [Actinobacteria bacterium]|nr:cysteine hydrolase [Actinomycetota bacterium]